MVDFSTRWEVVNGLPAVRALGHGAVTQYLANLGVARSSAYRWEKQSRWLARAAFAEHSRGVGTVAAVDEIFLGQAA